MADDSYIRQIVQQEMQKKQQVDQYGVNRTPVHTHNGLDSPKIDFGAGLTSRQIYVTSHVPGASAATASNYGFFFTNIFNVDSAQGFVNKIVNGMTVITFAEVHGTAGTVPGCKVGLFILRSTGGTDLVGEFALDATPNVLRPKTLKLGATPAILYPADALALSTSGTLTTVANVLVTVLMQY